MTLTLVEYLTMKKLTARDLEMALNVIFTSVLLARGGVNQQHNERRLVASIATEHAKRIADEYKDVIEDE